MKFGWSWVIPVAPPKGEPMTEAIQEVATPWKAGCECATRRMDVMNVSSIAHSKWAMCLWSVAARRGFLAVKELLLKGLVRCELGHQDARLGKATIW
jgi:hypothetical protein